MTHSKKASFLAILSLLAMFASASSFAAPARAKCDPSRMAGSWINTDSEKEVTTIITIPANGKGITYRQMPVQTGDVGLVPDFVFCDGDHYRMQFRFPEGYVDDNGTKAVYPLPADVALRLQGDLHRHGKNKMSFNMDLFDEFCKKGTGKPCPSAVFKRARKSEISGLVPSPKE